MSNTPYKAKVQMPAAVNSSGWVPTADRDAVVLAEAIASGKVTLINKGAGK